MSKLSSHEDNWVTKIGGLIPGEKVLLRGRNLFTDLNSFAWMHLLLFAITGREFSENQIRLFEGIWVISASYPDPRIWNNRIVSLGATARTTGNLSISAAIAASEAKYYGQIPLIKSIDLLIDFEKRKGNGDLLEDIVLNELKQKRVLYGFGRPIINKDERIKPLLELAKSLGFENGKYLKLVLEIDTILQKSRYKFAMNAAALDAALAADQGLTPNEFYMFMVLCFSAGYFPCYIDSASKNEGTFFPLNCKRVLYQGSEVRKW